jgi:site-specific DNA-methyltransferase (adenine-specific)
MNKIADGSIDAIICDLPYGTTACAWDSVIPFDALWKHYKRVIKPSGAIVLFGSFPFTGALWMSNPDWFKYAWVWEKNHTTDFVNANNKPLKSHEDILIFSPATTANGSARKMIYNPVGTKKAHIHNSRSSRGQALGESPNQKDSYIQTVTNYPRSVLHFQTVSDTVHPTQKPVELLEYLIKTYTNEGETVLDNCFGSGSCGVAAMRTKRRFVGIEQDAGYFAIGSKQIEDAARAANGLPKLIVGNPTDLDNLPMFSESYA